MSGVQYHVVVAFGIGADGALAPIIERVAANPYEATRLAHWLAQDHAGAIAFSRTMDIGRGRYGPAKIHAVEGQIPNDLQSMCGQRHEVTSPLGSEICDLATSELQSRTKPVSVVVRPARWGR